MGQYSRLIVISIASLLLGGGRSPADDAPKPDLKPLHAKVEKLVGKHYSKAKVTLKDQTISFEFNVRNFMIHQPDLAGEWQDAHEEVGPQKGGICAEITIHQGKYTGMAVAPQSFDMRYFTDLLLAPYSKKLDCHLYIHLKHPRDTSKEFLKEFQELVEQFEQNLSVPEK